jgi:hypothetical protein
VECNEVYEFQPRKCEMCAGGDFVALALLIPKWKPDPGLEYDASMAVEREYAKEGYIRYAGPKWRTDDWTYRHGWFLVALAVAVFVMIIISLARPS